MPFSLAENHFNGNSTGDVFYVQKYPKSDLNTSLRGSCGGAWLERGYVNL
jgi:hypothetical protein